MMKKTKKILLAVLSTVMTAACAFGVAGCNIGGGAQNNSTDAEAEFKTAYALYVTYAEANGQTPSTYEEWLATIKGEKGDAGEDGKSAYEIWLDNGHTGTQADFLEWLKGEAGEQGVKGEQGETGAQGPQGEKGEDGKSAYEIWLDNGHTGTQADFLEWLNGTAGVEGPQGPQGEQGETGPQGPQGEQGEIGPQGPQGEQGEAGVGIEKVECDEVGNWVITFTDGTVQIVETPYTDLFKISEDKRMVDTMNQVLAMLGSKDINYNDVAEALGENGYNVMDKNGSWNPSYKGYKAYWYTEKNVIVLVEGDQIIYPVGLKGAFNVEKSIPVSASSYVYTSEATTAEAAVEDIKTAFTQGNDVKLTKTLATPIEIDGNVQPAFSIKPGENITVDLGGNTIIQEDKNTADAEVISNYVFQVEKGGKLNIENGEMQGRGIMNYGTLNIGAGATVVSTDSNGGGAIKNKAGATVIIDGATIKVEGGKSPVPTFDGANPNGVENAGGTVIIKNSTIINETSGLYAVNNMSGTMEITNTTIKGCAGGVGVLDGTVTLNGCTVESTGASCYALYVSGGIVNVSGGTYTSRSGYVAIHKAGGTVNVSGNPTLNGGKNFAVDYQVVTAADLATALMNGAKQVTLTEDIKITGTIAVAENATTVINLNGKKLDASKNSSRPFDVTGNTTLIINSYGSIVNVGKYGLVNVAKNANATVVINGGTYIANENSDNGAFIKVREGATANITLNNVNYIDTTGENFILNAAGATANVTVHGGTYKAAKGFQSNVATFNNVTIETEGYAIYATKDSTITGCTIKTGDRVEAQGIKAAAFAISNGATLTVKNCNISGTYGLAILPGEKTPDGAIIVINTTNTATNPYYLYNGTATGYVEVDGNVVAGTK